jgi:hypothetical protein
LIETQPTRREQIKKTREESRCFKGKQEGGKRIVATKGRRRICKAMREDAIVVTMRKMDQLHRETCLMRKMLMGKPTLVKK